MTATDGWKKSSQSVSGSECVEVRADLGAVRDSKNPAHSIQADIRALISAVRNGRLG